VVAAPATELAGEAAQAERERRVRERWSAALPGVGAFSRDLYWLAIPAVDARYQRRACRGTEGLRWFAYLCRQHLAGRRNLSMLSLGCGTGALERKLAGIGAFTTCHGIDLAPAAIDAARGEAARAGIAGLRYDVRNLERDGPPGGRHDVAWFNGSLHHIERLEPVLDGVRDALAPDGWLFVNEYVGADRFAFPAHQREAMGAAFALLPARLRRSCHDVDRGRLVEEVPMPDPAEVMAVDPSEAVRSSAILAAIESRFEIVERNDCGGTLLQFLLAGIAGNFRDDSEDDRRYLEMLFAIEDALIDAGELQSDFVVLAARPRRA